MSTNLEPHPSINLNPVLSVTKDGIILYSNAASKPLLQEWGVRVGESLPSSIVELVLRVISRNSPEKIEIKAGDSVFLIIISTLPEQECVNISGFDISDQKEDEEKLRESENKYRNIVETSVEGIWIFNAVSKTTYVNEKMAEMLGYKPEEMIGRFIWDFAYEEEKGIFQVKLANRKQGIDEVYEIKLIHRDGSPVWFSVSAKGFFDDAGKFTGSGGMFTDITDRRRAEEALRESEEKYRVVADNTYDWEFWLDPDGHFLYMSPSCERVTGYAVREFMANPSLLQEIIHSDDLKVFLQHQHDKLSSRHGDIEFRIVTKDGEIRWIHHMCQPIYNVEGRYTGSRGNNRDITERKRTEEALWDSKAKIESIFRSSPVGIGVVVDRIIMEANERLCEMTGYSREELLGKSALMLYPTAEEYERVGRIKYSMISEHGTGHVETRWRKKNGSIVDILLSSSPFIEGNLSEEVTFTALDITERKRAEETLAFERSQLLSIFDGMDDMVYVADPYTYEILYANKAMKEQFGGEYEGRICYRELQLKNSPCDFCTNQIILKEKDKPYKWEYYNPKVNRFFMIMDRIIKWPDGRDVRLEIAKDITERKIAEEAFKKVHENLEEKVKERTAELEKAYNSLKESETSLAEAQEMAHIGNWEWDIATDKSYCSDELYRIFKRDPQELAPAYNEFLNYIHPDDRLDYVNMANKALNEKSSLSVDFRIILADGEERTVHMLSEIIYDEKNCPVRIKGIVQDITERKKAEENIHHLANIVEYTNDGIGLITPEGIVLEWNKGEERIYGYEVGDIVGRHISILAPPNSKNEPMDHVEIIKQTRTSYNYTASRLRKDGKMIEVSITLSPVFDSHGKLTSISFITRDITEQKMYEEKLRESEEKYRNIVEIANEGISILDSEGKFTYINRKHAEMLGYSEKEIYGKYAGDFVEDVNLFKKEFEQRKLGVSESYELKLVRKDGSPIWVVINAKSLLDKDGKFMGSLSMLTDITERKKAEEMFANLEIARKKELHHRIKNNLQIISSLLDLQSEFFKGREDIRDSEVLNAFKVSIDRVLSIALIHEELYKGKNIELLNFSQYIKELAENLILTYKLETDISFYFDLEEKIFLDMDTAIPLGIIINELITNSFKYAFSGRDKGEIQIKLHREESGKSKIDGDKNTSFTLSVSDNGKGIPEDIDIENLDSLGLQLVTTLVDQLEGELELKRDNGTEFTIIFKIEENKDQAPALVPQFIDND